MKKLVTVTRKIQLIVNQDNPQEIFHKLYNWQEIVFRASNYAATHIFIQENLNDFFYFTEKLRLNLSNKPDKDNVPGVLTTSRQNSTYQLLSNKFKGEIPTSILSALNAKVFKTFKTQRVDYFAGKRSLSTYKRTIPIPIQTIDMKEFKLSDDLINYSFSLYKIKFKTSFGKDMSNNKSFFDRYLEGKYKLANSSIKLEKNKIFLLAVFQFESAAKELDIKKVAHIQLSLEYPLFIKFGKKTHIIGNKEEFLHRRLSIQRAIRNAQINAKYNNGGKGVKKKLKSLNQWKTIERNYISTKLHTYSRMLIDFCLENEIGTIHVISQENEVKSLERRIKEIKEDSNIPFFEKRKLIEESKFVIRNWSYHGLIDKIQYKANEKNINVKIAILKK